jgi:hypothetical protein
MVPNALRSIGDHIEHLVDALDDPLERRQLARRVATVLLM